MTTYNNTNPSQPLTLYPRAVYRMVVERSGLTALSYATGVLRWRQVVEGMIDRSASPAGFPLGGGLDNVTNDDKVAVVDYRAGSHPGSLTVGDLVRAVEDSTPYSSVVSVTRRDPVPSVAEGGPDALAQERDHEKTAAEAEYAATTWYAKLGDRLQVGATLVLGVAAVAAVVAVVIIFGKRGD